MIRPYKKITCLSSPPVRIFCSRPPNYILYAHAQMRGQRAHTSKPAAIKKDNHAICRSPNTKWCKAPQAHSHFHATSKELSFMYICCCVKVSLLFILEIKNKNKKCPPFSLKKLFRMIIIIIIILILLP